MPLHMGAPAPPVSEPCSFQLRSPTTCQASGFLLHFPSKCCSQPVHTLATSQTKIKVLCRGTEKLAAAKVWLESWKLGNTCFMMAVGRCPKHKILDKFTSPTPPNPASIIQKLSFWPWDQNLWGRLKSSDFTWALHALKNIHTCI